jgi:hypothetical protein
MRTAHVAELDGAATRVKSAKYQIAQIRPTRFKQAPTLGTAQMQHAWSIDAPKPAYAPPDSIVVDFIILPSHAERGAHMAKKGVDQLLSFSQGLLIQLLDRNGWTWAATSILRRRLQNGSDESLDHFTG